MLRDGVVADAADIDLCMILGAGWRGLNGGITPYLDREGVSQRMLGTTINQPPVAGIGGSSPTATRPHIGRRS
jgi:3-hydroxyacyl-CoA dehydrogenase/enoyl-CoA hydratase/3-hydroxybutyryl-CoA epimerase